jgi:hypothetical protein
MVDGRRLRCTHRRVAHKDRVVSRPLSCRTVLQDLRFSRRATTGGLIVQDHHGIGRDIRFTLKSRPRRRTMRREAPLGRGSSRKTRTVRLAASSYCAFGASDGLGAGVAPVGAAFFFFFFFGGSLGCFASGCWASAVDAVITETATAKLAARPARRNSFRREITSGSLGLLMVNLSAFCG